MKLIESIIALYNSDLEYNEKHSIRSQMPEIDFESFYDFVEEKGVDGLIPFERSTDKVDRIKTVKWITGCYLREANEWVQEHYTNNGAGQWITSTHYVVGEIYRAIDEMTGRSEWVTYQGLWQDTTYPYFELHLSDACLMLGDGTSWKVESVEEYVLNKLQRKLNADTGELVKIVFDFQEPAVLMDTNDWKDAYALTISDLADGS